MYCFVVVVTYVVEVAAIEGDGGDAKRGSCMQGSCRWWLRLGALWGFRVLLCGMFEVADMSWGVGVTIGAFAPGELGGGKAVTRGGTGGTGGGAGGGEGRGEWGLWHRWYVI